MERTDRRMERWENRRFRRSSGCNNRGGGLLTGLLILIIGIVGLLKAFMMPIPDWVFSWQMLLIALGIFIGIRHQFRNFMWLILILVGGIFLMNDLYPELSFSRYSWPLALIVIGGWLILRPRHRHHQQAVATEPTASNGNAEPKSENYSSEDFIDNTSIFGGIKKTILAKNFKGGDIVNIMGGTEINLSQADIQGIAELEITQVFGGTKLIVPSHWEVKQEVVALFGGIEDRRPIQQVNTNPTKVLILKGTTLFGGIEIKSF
jgi:predicted membrane protein